MADQFYGLTDPGKERKNNEDTFIAQQNDTAEFIIASVIDGVGGYAGGEIAAALARDAILIRLGSHTGEIIPMLIDCFTLANEQILEGKKETKEHDSMACVATLALVDISHNLFYYAHVGDTRLYLWRDGSLVKISHDQSFVGFLEDSGRLSEEAAMAHPKRNEINKALGFEASLAKDSEYIETGQSPFLPGDMLLLCSDGLTDMVAKAEISDILNNSESIKQKCRQLIDAANKNGGRDNITVVLVQNNKEPLRHDATMPAPVLKKTEPAIEKIGHHSHEPAKTSPVLVQKKSSSGWAAVFAVLMAIFMGATVWFYLQSHQPVEKIAAKHDSPELRLPGLLEVKLQQAIDHAKGKVLILSDTTFNAPIVISRAILITKDSLLIKAKGKITLQPDTFNKGAAFQLTSQCKNITLDSLTFKGFQIGVASGNGLLQLKNVRFIDCIVPLQTSYSVAPKKYISGKMPVAAFHIDSLPLTNKAK